MYFASSRCKCPVVFLPERNCSLPLALKHDFLLSERVLRQMPERCNLRRLRLVLQKMLTAHTELRKLPTVFLPVESQTRVIFPKES